MFHSFDVDKDQYMGPLDFQLKNNYIFNNSDFILSNEFLFKNGVYKLKSRLSNNPIKRLNQIVNKQKAYVIVKSFKEAGTTNFSTLSPNKEKPSNIKPLYTNYVKNASEIKDKKKIANKINFPHSNITKTPNKDISTLAKKYLTKPNNISNISNNTSNSNSLNKTAKKHDKNNKSQIIIRHTFSNASINNNNKNVKTKILLPKMKIPKDVFYSNLKRKLIYTTDGDKTYSKLKKYKKTEKVLDFLKKTQLRFIKKHQTELFKRSHSRRCENFRWVLNDYLSKHNHENFFSLDAADPSSKIVKTFNILESTKNKIPEMRDTVNEIEIAHKEAEELKMKILNVYLPEDVKAEKRNKIQNLRLNKTQKLKLNTEIPKNENKFKNFYKTQKIVKKEQKLKNFNNKNCSKLITTNYNKDGTLYERICDLFRQNMKLNEQLYEFRK